MLPLTGVTALPLAQPVPLPASPLGRLLIALVALAVVVLVGRVLLSVAWKLVVAASVVVGVLYGLSLLSL